MNIKSVFTKYSPLLVGLLLLVLWQLVVPAMQIPIWILPTPIEIGYEVYASRELLINHLIPTLIEASIGLFVAIVLALGLAMLLEWSKPLKKIVFPYLVLSQTIPTIALAPLLAIWFGFGMLSKVLVVILICFFPITVNTLDGFAQSDESSLKFLKTLRATPLQLFRYCKIPYSLPSFFAGLRIAVTYSILGAVISEWFGGNVGLGVLLIRSAKSYLTARVFAIVVIISVVTLVAVWMVDLLAKKVLPWTTTKTTF
jgi:ABC-type nitrate/sulfonate/bicarbonate transport system permease component